MRASATGDFSPDDDATGRDRAARLRAVARDLVAFADQIDATATADNPVSDASFPTGPIARSLYYDRRLRGDVFPFPGLFGEPAWDILLDLHIAGREQKPISVTSACIGAAAPTTTALRYLSRLEELSLVQRTGDPADRRRTLLQLTDKAASLMELYLLKSNIGRLLHHTGQ